VIIEYFTAATPVAEFDSLKQAIADAGEEIARSKAG
jgi:hypothetical protein